jgi:hypothetical protein
MLRRLGGGELGYSIVVKEGTRFADGVTIITMGNPLEYEISYFEGGERNIILPKLMSSE